MYYPLTERVHLVNLEAMSVGRPIITTNTAGCKETVLNGINGFLVQLRIQIFSEQYKTCLC